jgi:5-formyltetrahydrofolate cyclo-ligase
MRGGLMVVPAILMMNDLKAQQRRKAYDARNAQADKEAASRVICNQITVHPAYQQAKTVMWYIHCRSEVRTEPTLRHEISTDKRIIIPYCTKDVQGRNKLGLWWLEDFAELAPGMWGILEPPKQRWREAGKEIAPDQLDCIIVPGVAFDRRGGRLGNGAGYYDRLLRCVRADAVLIGACYESQLLDRIAMESHDVAMDFVITEKAIYTGPGRSFAG